ncbi:MAG: peptide-methionine (R)-S-oxide reductase [Spirochaetes bacterium]|nr:MAG: peptide-methionine (R)-S-oxide reductase [Spirochaetota bacterium]
MKISRRRLLLLAGAGIVAAAVGREITMAKKRFEVEKTDEEWRALLSPEQYDVLRNHGTERAGSSPLDREHREGTFYCAACDLPVFESRKKFDSGTGWPSFWEPLPGGVETSTDFKLIYPRTEVHCARCGGHLGHVFDDGPAPTGKRYCMNGIAMIFRPRE